MPLLIYRGIDREGKTVRGTLEAANTQTATAQLLQRGIFVSALKEGRPKAKDIPKKELLQLTGELMRLLSAGLPLFESLSALEEKYRDHPVHPILLDLAERVKKGERFSDAILPYEKTFGLLYASMIANAEKTGNLEGALSQLAQLLERGEKVKKQLLNTFLYPSLLLCFSAVVFSVLLFYVVPTLSELFDGRNLHPMTRFVFALSEWAIRGKVVLQILCLLLLGFFVFAIRSGKGRIWMQKAPFFRQLLSRIALVRFAQACASLLQGGVPLVEALKEAKGVLKHRELERVVDRAEARIRAGEKMGVAFEGSSLIPPLVPRLLGLAQEGGSLGAAFHHIATFYEEELDRLLQQLSTVAQPALLLFLGGVVAFILFSVLLPMTDVQSFASP
jgi:general secretion pathway protein F/type IV pilus assembly protein PilC